MVQKTTDNKGKASFDVEYGDYDVTITKDGYTTIKETVQFRSNHKNFTIESSEIPQITVNVKNSNNEPVDGIKVTVYDEDRVRYMDEVITDSNGQAKGYVPLGEYNVNIYDPNDQEHYFDSTITVTENDKEFTLVWTYRENGGGKLTHQ